MLPVPFSQVMAAKTQIYYNKHMVNAITQLITFKEQA
jgi:hypothetical protein